MAGNWPSTPRLRARPLVGHPGRREICLELATYHLQREGNPVAVQPIPREVGELWLRSGVQLTGWWPTSNRNDSLSHCIT